MCAETLDVYGGLIGAAAGDPPAVLEGLQEKEMLIPAKDRPILHKPC